MNEHIKQLYINCTLNAEHDHTHIVAQQCKAALLSMCTRQSTPDTVYTHVDTRTSACVIVTPAL